MPWVGDMTKISIKAAVLLLILSFSNSFVIAQSSQEKTENSLSQSLAQSSEQAASEESDLFSNWSQTAAPVQQNTPSTLGLFVRMVLVLALVVAAIYGIMKLLRKGMKIGGDDSDPFLRKVSQVTLSPGKTVQIVTLFNHAYLVGVTDASVNLLGEIADKDLVDSMNLYADQHANVSRPRSFSDILNIFMPNASGAEGGETAFQSEPQSGNVFAGSTESATEELQRQRERLNGEQA